MKLQHLSVIFIIIVLPIILLLSYYISLQIDTISMKNSYTTKQLEATKEAVEAFEINTVEWNESYSETADSKRRDIMASINTFTTAFANSLGMGGATNETILPYIPAIACTLYDGYYIYSPAEIKEVVKDENGVVVFMTEELYKGKKEARISGYTYSEEDKGKILYQAQENREGIYNLNGESIEFTLNPEYAKTTYSHILKPYSTYSARYVKGNTDVTINYTLDNYINIYGEVNGKYIIKSGYLIDVDNEFTAAEETLTEKVAWKWKKDGEYNCDEYRYIYSEDNTKVYFDGNTAFQVNSIGIRTDISKMGTPKYKKLNKAGNVFYQALADYDINGDKQNDIIQGKWYNKKGDITSQNDTIPIGLKSDVSAINYYSEAKLFSEWVYNNLNNLKVEDMQSQTEQIIVTGNIFENVESEESVFNQHKREVIKQTLISNLNQAITSYSRNSEGEYQLPMLSETDWDQILRNVSIITFVQDIPIGVNYYNNYAIATSTSNKEFVNINEIYLHTTSNTDGYYHMPYCEKLQAEKVIGYRNLDYVIKSYETENKETKYYYKHENIANQACYYCLIQRSLFSGEGLDDNTKNSHENAYKRALARERYVTHEFR
ncbi:MAG: hypothetical protein IJE59_04910 [Clostridia bacterium]|nr:hypothetical protein [Clostridia bacterium]